MLPGAKIPITGVATPAEKIPAAIVFTNVLLYLICSLV